MFAAAVRNECAGLGASAGELQEHICRVYCRRKRSSSLCRVPVPSPVLASCQAGEGALREPPAQAARQDKQQHQTVLRGRCLQTIQLLWAHF